MNRYVNGCCALVLLIAATATNAQGQPRYSGFIRSVPALEERQDDTGTVSRYASPKLSGYKAVLIDPVVLYPEPKANEHVGTQTLIQIRDYFNKTLRAKVGASVKVVDAAGPGVLRLRVALTAVKAEKSVLKSYQMIPSALLLFAAKDASGTSTQDVVIYGEAEAVDSVSGEQLAVTIRKGVGTQLADPKSKIKLEHVTPFLDNVSASAAAFMASQLRY